jgi:carboxypeptidase T
MPSALGLSALPFATGEALASAFRDAALAAGGRQSIAGRSVDGRPLVRFDLGREGRPVVLLTALMHGVEVVGALALLDVLRRLGSAAGERLLDAAHWVILPVVNPDALATNLSKVSHGRRAWQRCNARGVDLNRNFPRLTSERRYHPFSGSSLRVSPHYAGPAALSEPESQAVRDIAVEARPRLSLAFHSFGNLLLYPWAYTAAPNPRAAEYRSLGGVLERSLVRFPYRVQQARQFYSILGDMDDWLDAEFGTMAFTVEVSRPQFSLRRARRLLNPFCWMNPERSHEIVDDLSPGILALLSASLGLPSMQAA